MRHGSQFLSPLPGRAVRLGIELFTHVVLDFTGVELVGQGFADELFRVWQSEHPEAELTLTGANRGVALMTSRAAKP